MEIEDGIATFPNGLQLRLTPGQVAPQAVYDAASRYPDPAVPVRRVTIDGTETTEENPDDPNYRQGIEAAKERRAWACVKALAVMGTELIEAPREVPGPEAVDWERVAYMRDLPTPTNRYEKYELWLRYYGFAHGYKSLGEGLADYVDLMRYLAVEAGMSMEGPAALAATFRSAEGRAVDPAGDDLAVAGDGDVSGRPAAPGLV